MQVGLEESKPLVGFCQTFLQGFEALANSDLDEVLVFWASKTIEAPIVDAMGRIQRVCKALLHIMCCDIPGSSGSFSDEEVLKVVNFKGTSVFEGAVMRVLTDTKFAWSKETSDMVKKGGAAVLAEGKVQSLQSLLQIESPSGKQFKEMHKLMREVQDTVRNQKIKQIKLMFAGSFKKHSMQIRSGQASNSWMNSTVVDSLLDGLAIVHDTPGASDERRQLVSWRTSEVKAIARNDLMTMFEDKDDVAVDFPQVQACINHFPDEAFSVEITCSAFKFLLRALPDLMKRVS